MTALARGFPFLSGIGARVLRRDLLDSAVRRFEIAPACKRHLEPAICLEGELARVRGVASHDDLTRQLWYATTAEDDNGPTIGYELRDVLVSDQGVFGWAGSRKFTAEKRRYIQRGPIARQGEGLLCMNYVIQRYFGHFIRDGLALEEMAADMGMPAVAVKPRAWFHEAAYREKLGRKVDVAGTAHLARLVVAEDVALNGYRIARAGRLRSRFQQAGGAVDAGGIVFLSRGVTGEARRLVNEAELIEGLGAQGVEVLHPESSEVETIAAVLHRAKIVIAVEGSAVMHGFMGMRPGTGIIVIQPPDRFSALARMFFSSQGISYGFTVADPHEHGFVQPLDRLLRTVDRLRAAIG